MLYRLCWRLPLVAKLHRSYRRFLAVTRLSPSAVCELSAGMGDEDYHDYPDDTHGQPHFFGEMHCKRCGKTFRI